MILTLPDEPVLASFDESELKLELAVALFSSGRVSRSVAASIAGLDRFAFDEELFRRRIPSFTADMLEQDLASPPIPPDRVIVVTDTSVVLNLCLLGLEEVLPMIFGEVQAPAAVKEEFLRLANVDRRFTSLVFPAFIVIHSPGSIHPLLLTPRLHKGECEALSLAAEIRASRVLMDEQAGRAAALKLGLNCIGLLGILIEARRQNLIPRLAPYLDRLQDEARFWFSQSLRIQVLQLAGEIP